MNLTLRSTVTRRAGLLALLVALVAALLLGGTATNSAEAATRSCGPSTPTTSLPTLRYGDTGSCVKYAQALLLAHEVMIGTGYPDGKFGPGTLRGVKNFQTWFKVKGGADGVIGQNTWKALRSPYVNPVG